MADVLVAATKLCKNFQDADTTVSVLEQLSFNIYKGERIALMGQSGAGKSTLLHVLGGFESIDSGEIRVGTELISDLNDKQLSRFRREQLGMVFQQYNLISSLNVYDNITFTRRLKGMPASDDSVDELINILGIQHRLKHRPEQLSGGEQQRVAIARALAAKPKLLLADEPTGNLDEETAEQVMTMLIKAAAIDNITLLLVTHSHRTAAYLDKTWIFERGSIVCSAE